MQAVILAAGRARRLGPIGHRMPKCLLEIGGRALIEYSLDNLVQSDLTRLQGLMDLPSLLALYQTISDDDVCFV